MNKTDAVLLNALKASVRARPMEADPQLSPQQWQELFEKAGQQHLLGLLMESVYRLPSYLALDEELRSRLRRRALQGSAAQARRSRDFVLLMEKAGDRGLDYVLVKGLLCRSLYPKPDARGSSDEDILVPWEQFALWRSFLEENGLRCAKAEDRSAEASELSFVGSGLYLELHSRLFPAKPELFNSFNRCFDSCRSRAVDMQTPEGTVTAMEAGEHLLYLILHAFKHFVHSGFGLRQLCDIVLWAESCGSAVDWAGLCGRLESFRCMGFAAAVFRLGSLYLELDRERARIPAELDCGDEAAMALLEDMLSAGVYGNSDRDRLHSGNITLQALEQDGKGSGLLRSLFPDREYMKSCYPRLGSKRLLLPAAWCLRLGGYALELLQSRGSASASLSIGRARRQLLKKLDIID